MTLTDYATAWVQIRLPPACVFHVELVPTGHQPPAPLGTHGNLASAEAHALQIREALHAIVKGALLRYQAGNLDLVEATPPRTTS